MKRRFVMLIMSVALLLTALPSLCAPVHAASELKASEARVGIIKKWGGFSAKPYWDYRQWTVGYGTRVPDGKLDEYKQNGISTEEAEQLLDLMLTDMSKDINSFADKFGLTFNQGQFDALLSLTFNCGSSWTQEVSIRRTAIME